MRRPFLRGSITALMVVSITGVAAAQRTRFPGDSPTRPAVMGGRVLGTPSGRRPVVPTFTIPQGGYRNFGYGCGYSYFGGYSPYAYYGSYAYNGPYAYYGATPRFCSGCGCLLNQCVCATGLLYPGLIVDYRSIYGLQAAANFADPAPAQAMGPIAPLDRLPPAPAMPAAVSSSRLEKAWRMIDYGDRHLREGRLRDAHTRYRRAASAAPELADVRFRQALVELALGNVEDAADALREGLRRDPAWPDSGFDLTAVYSEQSQQQVLGLLTKRLADFPNDADALLLSGVVHHFRGDDNSAQRQFDRAVRVSGGASVARLFLAEQPELRDAAALVE